MIEVGNKYRAGICVYLDETEAIELAECVGMHDGFAQDLMKAVEQAYPKLEDDGESEDES